MKAASEVSTKKRLQIVLIATIIGSSIATLDGSIVNLALPKIALNLHASFASLQWIVDGYMLTLSSLILLGGSLGDIIGRKKIYLTGLAGFGVCSLLCALAPSTTILVIARVLQGIFGALLVPGALSIINTNFPKEARSKAIGQWTAWGSISILAAPFLGGWILDVASWRYIFLVNIPLVIICFCLALPSITEGTRKGRRKIDGIGALFASLMLAGLTYGLIEGPAQHWTIFDIAALVGSIIFGALFLMRESRTSQPMINTSLFASRNFTGSNLMTFGMYGALSGFTLALVIYLQTQLHYSSIQAGLSSMPVTILMLLFAGRVGGLSGKYGPRRFMTIGPLLVAAGIAYLHFLHAGASYLVHILPGILVFGVGLVLTVSPLTTTVMASVEDESSGIASGINNAVARAAGLIVVALLGLLGPTKVYAFATILSAVLAASAGLISFFMIEKKQYEQL